MSALHHFAAWAQRVLLPLGSWGLLIAAVADSSVVPLPSGVDVWLISLSMRNAQRAPLYVLVASIGSVIGATALMLAVSKGEKAFLTKKLPPKKIEDTRRKIEDSGFWALVIGGLLPPPTPFKLFIVAAGLLRYPLMKFIMALLVSRLIRYALEAYLAVRYGQQAWALLLHAGPSALAAALFAMVLFIIYRRRRDLPHVPPSETP